MSDPTRQTVGMELKTPTELDLSKTNETIGFLGATELIRRYDGVHELVGGTELSRAIARVWCEFFAPEIVFAGGRSSGLGSTGVPPKARNFR